MSQETSLSGDIGKRKFRKVSTKQSARNREVARIKSKLPLFCAICGRPANDAAHLLPKSIYPGITPTPLNLVILCREHHTLYDNDITFRRKQTKLFNQICRFDERAARKHFKV